MSSISSYNSESDDESSVYLSCDDTSSISTLDRAEVGRVENTKLYGPRSHVQMQTEVIVGETGGKLHMSVASSD